MSLTPDESEIWHLWKAASEGVRTRVVADITERTGLSDPDFAVLTRVTELGDGGTLRQNVLAASMGWHRSRLSHHLGRMQERGLIERATVPGGVEVTATDEGSRLVRQARPVHGAAVRKYLLDVIPEGQKEDFVALLQQLA
ncbi:transcriptional regulator [Rhodococcoides trifolii]|uniref:Transcriptional regulator n=1 Tax=Rhodococcoides trifolii TaxID=908250 RepID=A0A917CT96_9NOCA|nr:MarR family winged helix-turn-helix transcriptional regulator [Rhodococcus trifolii]GGF97094.1 transcriptional regulator [Rhodococcus trifolii]